MVFQKSPNLQGHLQNREIPLKEEKQINIQCMIEMQKLAMKRKSKNIAKAVEDF